MGYSDIQIAQGLGKTEDDIYEFRLANGIMPTYKIVDTCAVSWVPKPCIITQVIRATKFETLIIKKAILGGSNRIGQGIEFDYCCVHASMAIREHGYESIMVNPNPETVSTDFDTSDRLYFEPLTVEDVCCLSS